MRTYVLLLLFWGHLVTSMPAAMAPNWGLGQGLLVLQPVPNPTNTPLPTATIRPSSTPTPENLPTPNGRRGVIMTMTPGTELPRQKPRERQEAGSSGGGLAIVLVGLSVVGLGGGGFLTARVLRARGDNGDPIATAYREEERQKQAERRQVAKTARGVGKRLIEELTQLGLCYRYLRGNRYIYSKVRFDECFITDDHKQLWFRIGRKPYKITLAQLLETAVCEQDLSVSIGRGVVPHYDAEIGAFYIVEMEAGAAGVPRMFEWYSSVTAANAIGLLPKSRPFCVAIGLASNSRLIYEDFREWTHILIAGATKWGKTSWIHQALCTLISRNGPDRVRLVLFDFKRGVGLNVYRGIPHLWGDYGFIFEKSEAAIVLEEIRAEMDRRFDLFYDADTETIEGYNYRKSDKRLPYLLIVIDELAHLMTDPEYKNLRNIVESLMMDLTARGRAAGVFLWAGTQTPKTTVITTLIKSNMAARMAFHCVDYTSSQLILDSGEARGLGIKGRMVYQFAGERVIVQGPYISREQITELVSSIARGDGPDAATLAVPPGDVWEYALNELGGNAPIRQIWGRFRRHGASQIYVRRLLANSEFDPNIGEPIITIGDMAYVLLPGYIKKPRRLLLLAGPDQVPDAEEFTYLVENYEPGQGGNAAKFATHNTQHVIEEEE